MTKTHDLACPACGSKMVLRYGPFKYKDGSRRPFYGCSEYPICKQAHGAHPDGAPLGIPTADPLLKELRKQAHEVFDQLWKGGQVTRMQAYKILQDVMGMTKSEAHIAKFNVEQCEKAIRLLKEVV